MIASLSSIAVLFILYFQQINPIHTQPAMHNSDYCDYSYSAKAKSPARNISYPKYTKYFETSVHHGTSKVKLSLQHPSGYIKPLDRRKSYVPINTSTASISLHEDSKRRERIRAFGKASFDGGSHVEFVSSIVNQELIVTLDGYYSTTYRRRTLLNNLMHCGISDCHFNIIARTNPAAKFPSDFDVVEVEEDYYQEVIDIVTRYLL